MSQKVNVLGPDGNVYFKHENLLSYVIAYLQEEHEAETFGEKTESMQENPGDILAWVQEALDAYAGRASRGQP